jgi:hypothetical protein
MFSFYESAPALFTVKEPGNFSIDFRGTPEMMTIPLHFRAGTNGNFLLTASNLTSFTSTTIIQLEDTKTNQLQNLMLNPEYPFSAVKEDNPSRFLLHFGGTFHVNENVNTSEIAVYQSEAGFTIRNLKGSPMKGLAILYNLIGQQMTLMNLDGQAVHHFSFSGSTGYYIIKIKTEKESVSKKVFYRKP